MVTTNIKYVLDLLEREKLRFFTVFNADGKTPVFKQENEEASVSEAYNMLEDFFNNCEPGIVNIKLSEISNKEKANGGGIKQRTYEMRVRVGASISKQAGTDANLIGGEVKGLLMENYSLKLQIEQMKLEAKQKEELRKLEEKIEGLKENDPLEKYAPMLMHFFGGQKLPVQGIAGTEEPQQNDTKARITKALNRLLKIDSDFCTNLELLADFAEKSPEKYKSFVPMLKMM